MGKISKVLYTEIDSSLYSTKDAGETYFHQNAIRISDIFTDGYEKHETKQMTVRNKCIGRNAEECGVSGTLKMNSVLFGVSSIKEHVVAIVEL